MPSFWLTIATFESDPTDVDDAIDGNRRLFESEEALRRDGPWLGGIDRQIRALLLSPMRPPLGFPALAAVRHPRHGRHQRRSPGGAAELRDLEACILH